MTRTLRSPRLAPRHAAVAALAVALFLCAAMPARAADADDAPLTMPKTPNDIRDAHVQVSIAHGIRYLQGIQQSDGLIGTTGNVLNFKYPVGQTALALLAMLEAGTPLTDRHVQRAFNYVFETPTDHTYEVALQAMVLAKLPNDRLGRSERRAMERLLKRFVDGQARDGMWTYWLMDPRKVPGLERGPWGRIVGRNWRDEFWSGDRSNTQFAILGLWEMSKRGVEIPKPLLKQAADQFLSTQTAESGWGYINDPEKYGHPVQAPTMNATGLASLYILRDLLGEVGEGLFDGSKSPDCGKPGPLDEAIERAHNRVVRDLGVTSGLMQLYGGEPFPRSGYYSYSIERVGVACGLKQLGDHDWYREGAWYFLRNQQRDGSWTVGYNPAIETSLALLFLAKGRAPFIINKLRWRGDWNNHTRDLANFVRYAENTFEQRFRWQIVDILGKVDEWLDAPILFISGHQSPRLFTDEEKEKLREFAKRGGIILADDCCQSKEFDEGFRKLVADLFPDAPLKELGADHRVFSAHFKLMPDVNRPLLGVDLPVADLAEDAKARAGKDATRTVVFYAPWTLGCVWNQNLLTNHERVFKIAVNIFRYAMGEYKLRRPLDGPSKLIPAEAEPPAKEPPAKLDEPALR